MEDGLYRWVQENRETYKRLARSVNMAAKSINAVMETLEPVAEELIKRGESIDQILSHLQSSMSPTLNQIERISEITRTIATRLSPSLTELVRSVEALPPKVRNSLLLLADHGWYYDVFNGTFPHLISLVNAIEDGEPEVIDEYMVEYFDQNLTAIEDYLLRLYPNRRSVITAAFRAHQNGEYELSTLAFFSQVDGICWETTGYYFFMRKAKRPQTAQYVENLARRELTDAMLSVLSHPVPVNYNCRERDEGFSELNRHMVLHGESCDYGTKQNSLKALSLLNHVAQALEYGEAHLRKEVCNVSDDF